MAVIVHFRYFSYYRSSCFLMEPLCTRLGEFNSLSDPSIRHNNLQLVTILLVCCRYLGNLEFNWTVAIHRENMSASPGTTPKHHFRPATTMWNMIVIDWVSLKQS